MALPLKTVDLASKDIFTLSFAGSHSLLDTSEKRPGIPSLAYRQFSDFHPGGPLFAPLAEIMIVDDMGEPVEPELLNYVWRPDFVRSRFKFEGFTEMQQILAYTDEETCVCDIKLKPLGGRSLHVRVAGSVSENADANITKLPNKGFSVQVQAEMKNEGSARSSRLQKSFTVVFSTPPAHLSNGGRSFSADFITNAAKEVTLTVVVSERSAKGNLARTLARPSKTLSQTTRQVNYWLAEVEKPAMKNPDAVKMYYNAWYQLWQNIERPAGFWTHSIVCPGKMNYARGTWLWNTAFHVMALLYGGESAVELAKDQVRVFIDASKQVGHLPSDVWPDALNPEVQPSGILTWAAMEIYKKSEDRSFLEEIYPALADNNRWFYTEGDSSVNGLCEWLYVDQIKLAEMCDALGNKPDAAEWRDKAESIKKHIIEQAWDEVQGCYRDLETGTGQTSAMFLPMFAGIATDEQAERLVKQLDLENYWHEPVRLDPDLITILGLERYGYHDKAGELRRKIIELIEKNPVPMEYYDPLTGKGQGAINYTPAAALYIVLCND